jgi:hypothetical protein
MYLLQTIGIPIDPEIKTIITIFGIFLIGAWVYLDAIKRDSKWPWLWALCIVILLHFSLAAGIVGLLIYLYLRDEKQEQEQEIT